MSAGTIVGPGGDERQSVGALKSGTIAIPGLVNAHSHAFQRAFRGQVQWSAGGEDNFWSWREAMYRVANALGPEEIEAISALAFCEMAESGITTVGEFHYLHYGAKGQRYDDPDELAKRVLAGARRAGIRVVLLRVVYGRHSPGKELAPNQRRFGDRSPDEALRAVERLSMLGDPLVSVGLAPHSVRAVPADWRRELRAHQGIVHAHVSEQPGEVEGCLAAEGCSPLVAWARSGLVSERFTAVHLTHPTAEDLEVVRSAGPSVCVCPTTELDLGDGWFPNEARGASLCFGTDSQAQIDPFEELRSIELHGRGVGQRRNVMAPPGDRHGLARKLLGIGIDGGARSLGLAPGRIEEGARGDVVVLDLNRPACEGVPPDEALVFGARPEWVDEVWVGGEQVVAEGRHLRRDEIVAGARPALERLFGSRWPA